jgi:hypothetical protein
VLFPFMGFVLGCIAFSILGTLVLVLDPRLRWSIGNVMIFIVGAFAGVVGYSITYYCLVGDQPMDSAAAALSAIFTFAGLGGWLLLSFIRVGTIQPPGAESIIDEIRTDKPGWKLV